MSGFGNTTSSGLTWSLGKSGFCFFPRVADNNGSSDYLNGIYYPYKGGLSYIDGRAIYVGYYNGPHEFVYPYLYRRHSYYKSKAITKPYSSNKTCYDYYSRFSTLSYNYSVIEQEYQVKDTKGKQCIFSGNQFFFKGSDVYSWAGITYGDTSAYGNGGFQKSLRLGSTFSARYLVGRTTYPFFDYNFIQVGRLNPNWNLNFIHMSAAEADVHGYYSKHPEIAYPVWELNKWATEGHIIYKNGKQWRSFKEETHFYPIKDIMNIHDVYVGNNVLLVAYYRPKPYELHYERRCEAVISAYVKSNGVYSQIGSDEVICTSPPTYLDDLTKIVINNSGTEVALYSDPNISDDIGYVFHHRVWRVAISLNINEETFSVSVTENELINTSTNKQRVLAIAYDDDDKLRLLISDDTIINKTPINGWVYENSVRVLERIDGEDDNVLWTGYGHALNPMYIKSIIFLYVDLVERIYIFSELTSTLDNPYVQGEITYGPFSRTQRIVFYNDGEETVLYTYTISRNSNRNPFKLTDDQPYYDFYPYAYAISDQSPHRYISDECDYYTYGMVGGLDAFSDEWYLLYPFPNLGTRQFLFENHIYDVAVVVDHRSRRKATESTPAIRATWAASVRIRMIGACNDYIDITWMNSSFGDLHNYIPTCDSNGNKLSESTNLSYMSLNPIGLY